jgi:hypothetical protein
MSMHIDTSHPAYTHVFVLPSTDETIAADLFDGDPPPGKWVLSLCNGHSQVEMAVIAKDADQLADFIAEIAVTGATKLRAAGVDLPGRIHDALAQAGLETGDHTTQHDQQEGNP